MSTFGSLALGGLGSALDWGLDMLSGILGQGMSKDTAKSLLKRQFGYQKELMRLQNDYNVYNYQHQHQWRVTDLRDAGLNPILSATSNSAVAPVGNTGVGLPSAGFPSGNSARMSGLVRDLVQLNSARTQSEIRANDASAMERMSASTLNSAQAKRAEAETRKINAVGKTYEDYRSGYERARDAFQWLGHRLSDAILNSSWGSNRSWSKDDQGRVDIYREHKVSYDPERKTFNFK